MRNLDSILIKCHPLFERAETQLQNPETTLHELQGTLDDALAIDVAFSHWSTNQDAVTRWERQAHTLINDIIASIPYHLADNVHDYERTIWWSNGSPRIGRAVGGLLLLHPLFVLATCSIVPLPIHTYMTKCLAWIGKTMGIGQATLMSKVISPS